LSWNLDLKKAGFECWFAPHDVPIGAKIRSEIDEAIRTREQVVLILSKHSIASAWVEKEVETTFENETTAGHSLLFPVRIDSEVLITQQAWAADIRRQRHIGDFSKWRNEGQYEAALQRLISAQ
jgi:hypothetical protein